MTLNSFVFPLLILVLGLAQLAILDRTETRNRTTTKGSSMTEETIQDKDYVFQMDELNRKREESGKSYLSFLNVDSMHCGVYHLKAGAKDSQQPHTEDEVYYVESGKAKFTYGDKETDVKPGTVLFVPAKMEHRFHSIEEDLTLLVFFSKGDADQ